MDSYDRDILKALKGATLEKPIDLADILMWVDARQRLVLTHEELEGGLRRLIAAGNVAEAKPLHFYPIPAPSGRGVFSGVSAAQHADASREYHRRFEQAVKESKATDDEDPGRPLVVVRWNARDGKNITDADEDAAEELSDQLEPLLPNVAQAEMFGFVRRGEEFDILMWGVGGTDDEVDQIYHAVVGAFRAFGCPPGSAIIRYYEGGESELESDVQS